MNPIARWLKNSSPLVKGLMIVSVVTSFYIGNRLWYSPYVKRRRLKEAEEWANMIIEQEERMKEQNVKQ